MVTSNEIYLLNSSYSKDKIKGIFRTILVKRGLSKYILLSDLVQDCSVISIENPSIIDIDCGYHSIHFEYKKSSMLSLTEEDLKCLIAIFMISMENATIYENLVNSIAFGENKEYPTFNDLIRDINKEIEVYKRYGTPFCVAKIRIKNEVYNKNNYMKITSYLDTIKENVRSTDSIYIDDKNVYIILRDIYQSDAENVVHKLNEKMTDVYVGVAEWKSLYVVSDLLSEIDNYIYIELEKLKKSSVSLTEDLDKILNNAIFHNDTINIIQNSGYNKDNELIKKHEVFRFSLNSKNYIVLKNLPKNNDLDIIYTLSDDHIASDILEIIK